MKRVVLRSRIQILATNSGSGYGRVDREAVPIGENQGPFFSNIYLLTTALRE